MAETTAPPRPVKSLDRGPSYDDDFFLWCQHQAALIRAGHFELVDWANVAEEIESLGARDRRKLRSRLEVLMMHLLKWQFQPMHRSRRWRGTIHTQRGRIQRLLKDSPSLRREIADLTQDEYPMARHSASVETGLALETFPNARPYTPEQILDEDFFPGLIDET